MTNQVEKICKRQMKRIVKADRLDALLKTGVLISKTPLMKDGVLHYEVEYIRYLPISYEALVNRLIKTRYTDSAEFAVINKGIEDKTNAEYVEYNAFRNVCKESAREYIAERTALFGK